MLPRRRRAAGRCLATWLACCSIASAQTASVDDHLTRGDTLSEEGRLEEATAEYREAVRLDLDHAGANARLGLSLSDLGDLRDATIYLRRAAALEPEDLDVRTRLASVFFLRGLRFEAWDEAGAVLERDPNRLEALLARADGADTPAEVAIAIESLSNAGAVHETTASYQLALGVLRLKSGDTASAQPLFEEAIRLQPESGVSHLALGAFQLGKGDLEAASESFRRVGELVAPASAAPLRVVHLYRDLGHSTEAYGWLDEMLARDEASGPALARVAEFALRDGELERSAGAIEKLRTVNGEDSQVLRLLGELERARGEAAAAVELEERAAALLEEQAESRPDVAHVRFRLGELCARLGDGPRAVAELERVLAIAPDTPRAVLLLAELQMRSGRAAEAAALLESLLARREVAGAYALLGHARLMSKDVPKAREAYEGYLRLEPESAEAHFLLGSVLATLGRRRDAVPLLEEALRLDPPYFLPLSALAGLALSEGRNARALDRVLRQNERIEPTPRHHVLAGQLYEATFQPERAEAAYRRALDGDPTVTSTYGLLARLYLREGRAEAAVAEIDRGLARTPERLGLLVLKGVLLQQAGDAERAREVYERALEVDPNSAPAANNLAYLSQRDGRLDEALSLARRARAASPENPEVADTLGWILYERASYEEALALLEEASAGRPDNAEITYHLGFARQKAGAPAEARDALERALVQDPDSPLAERARAALDELR